MSQVFEALQRAEAERSGTDEALGATELMERAEREAESEQKSGAVATEANELQDSDELSALFQSALPTDVSDGEPFVAVEPADVARREEAFRGFKSVSVSPPAESRLICVVDKNSPAAEAFRLLTVRLRDLRKNETKPLKKVLITSTVPQEGKSFTAANLACALGMNPHQKTLLIEGDFRQPSLGSLFRIGRKPGVCEYLRGERSLPASIYHFKTAGIWFLPAGSPEGDPLRIIQAAKLPSLMDQLVQWFDWIIIDSPPVLPLADTTALARLSDGILLVTRRGTTKKRKLQKGLEALAPEKLIGALLNSSDGTPDNDYYYYRRDRKGSHKAEADE